LHLILARKDKLGRPIGRENAERVRLECQNDGWQREFFRVRHGSSDKRLMPEMDTVEIPQSDDGPNEFVTLFTDMA
jgi:hypothetical protein